VLIRTRSSRSASRAFDPGLRLIDLDEGTKLAGVERVAEREEDEENGSIMSRV